MTIKPWITNTGIKIKVGNKKANMALKLLNLRIGDCQKTMKEYMASEDWTKAAEMNSYINGLFTAFYVLYKEFKSK